MAGPAAPPPDRPSALKGFRAEKFGGATGLRAFLLPNLLAPFPLRRPSSPSVSAHVPGSPVALSKASASYPDRPAIAPGSRSPPPGPRPSVLSPAPLSSAALTRGSSSSILRGEGRGRWPRRGKDTELAREPRGSGQSSARRQRKHWCRSSQAGVETVEADAPTSLALPT